MNAYRAQEPTASSHVLNFLAVVLPLLNLWNVALEKGLVCKNPKGLAKVANAATIPAAVTAVLFALFCMSNLMGMLLRLWLKQRYGSSAVDRVMHNFIRDSGLFSTLMAVLSLQNIIFILQKQPGIVWRALNLMVKRRLIYYGQISTAQRMEVFFPPNDSSKEPVSGLVIFVHGGAWGSGSPAMYRLVALPFLKINWAVAVLGYRVYPEGDVSTQIADLESAAVEMSERYPNLCRGKVCLVGHSSGAHICMLALVERARRHLELSRVDRSETPPKSPLGIVDYFCGVSGPYNISHHFDFEAGRKVEQLSPLKPACGDSREMFLRYSPADQLKDILALCQSENERDLLGQLMPRMTLVHGLNDETVPFTSTKEAAQAMKSTGVVRCEEVYIEDTGHEEAIMAIMLGGQAQDILSGIVEQL